MVIAKSKSFLEVTKMINSANANVKETNLYIISVGHDYYNVLQVIIPTGDGENNEPITFRRYDNDREKLVKLANRIMKVLPEKDKELTKEDTEWYVNMIYSMVEGENELRQYRKAIGKF